jgi:membrane protein
MGIQVIDRFNRADGGLLAAGIAFNAVFALIPLALFATGIAGFIVSDPQSRDDIVEAVANVFPPLAGIVDEILTGLAASSTTATLLGLLIAGWGTSRLFASLESAVAQLDLGAPRRSLVHITLRRIVAVIIVGAIVLAALVAAPLLSIAQQVAGQYTVAGSVFNALMLVLPPVLGAVALGIIYRVLPLVRPSWGDVWIPAVVGGIVLVLLTQIFVFLAPRLFSGNVVYGTLGAILVGLTWLDLVFMVVLIGASWVVERRGTLVSLRARTSSATEVGDGTRADEDEGAAVAEPPKALPPA